MSEQPVSSRRLLQTRRIVCEGYARDDGLYEIEVAMVDAKPFAVSVGDRERIEAGEPFHEMKLRLVVDADLEVREVTARTLHAPYIGCPAAAAAYEALRGLNLQRGFMKTARERLGGTAGCTHLSEMLAPAVTTAMQTVWHVRDQLELPRSQRKPRPASEGKPAEVDRCHALRAGGEAVRKHYPQFHRPAAAGDAKPPAQADPRHSPID